MKVTDGKLHRYMSVSVFHKGQKLSNGMLNKYIKNEMSSFANKFLNVGVASIALK